MIGHLYRYPHPYDPTRFIYVGQGLKRDSKHRSGRSSFGRRFKRDFPGAELPQPIRERVETQGHLELNELETVQMFRYHTWHGYDGGMNLVLPGSLDYKNMGNIGGPIAGRKNVESGHIRALGFVQGRKASENGQLDSIRTLESCTKGGFTIVKSGQLARIRSAGGRVSGLVNGIIQGRKNVESGHIQAVGRIQGRKNAESGFMETIKTPESLIKGGRTAGRKAFESGQLASIRTFESCADGGRSGSHTRWHVRRNIVKKGCKFCEVS